MRGQQTFDWLWKDWLKLKKQLIMLCTRHVGELLDGNGNFDEDGFERFKEQVMREIQNRIPDDHSGLWQESLALLARSDELERRLRKDLRHPSDKLSPAQILGRAMQFVLEQARRELAALETGESPARVKTWERLDRISRRLTAADENSASIDRCSEEHFQQVHAEIKTTHAGDYNYPQKLTSIRDYFYIFCDCCKQRADLLAEDASDAYSLTRGGLSSLTDTLFGGEAKNALATALTRLPAEQRTLLNAAFGLGLEPVGYISEKAYMRDKGINPTEYQYRKQKALENLWQLFEEIYPEAAVEAAQ